MATSRRRVAVVAAAIAILGIPSAGSADEAPGPPFDGAATRPGGCGQLLGIESPDTCLTTGTLDADTGAATLRAEVESPDDGTLPGLGDWGWVDGAFFLTHSLATAHHMVELEVTLDIAAASVDVQTDIPLSAGWVRTRLGLEASSCSCDVDNVFEILNASSGSDTVEGEQRVYRLALDAEDGTITGDLDIYIGLSVDAYLEAASPGRVITTADVTVSDVRLVMP